MSDRIRYRKVNDNTLESTQTFQHSTNGAQYKVRLNATEGRWSVLDAVTELTAASGANAKRNRAQLEVREALKSLGIELNTEKRKERTSKSV